MEQVKIYRIKEPKNNSSIVNSMHKNAITTDTLGISEYVQDCVNSIWVNTIEALFSKNKIFIMTRFMCQLYCALRRQHGHKLRLSC